VTFGNVLLLAWKSPKKGWDYVDASLSCGKRLLCREQEWGILLCRYSGEFEDKISGIVEWRVWWLGNVGGVKTGGLFLVSYFTLYWTSNNVLPVAHIWHLHLFKTYSVKLLLSAVILERVQKWRRLLADVPRTHRSFLGSNKVNHYLFSEHEWRSNGWSSDPQSMKYQAVNRWCASENQNWNQFPLDKKNFFVLAYLQIFSGLSQNPWRT
jgi:hypothetical protein